MNSNDFATPSPDSILALVHGELSSGKRWVYRVILLAASVGVAALVSLWSTEPEPLPLRLHVAFAALTVIGTGWVGVLTWILTRRNCPTALDRIATAWMATIACSLFLIVSLPIAVARGELPAAASLALMGLGLLGSAVVMLRAAYAQRARLRSELAKCT
jgi:hypothetical protein